MNQSDSNRTRAAIRVSVYAFEKIGFALPHDRHESDSNKLRFERYDSTDPFRDVDGIIIPQGVFETLDWGVNQIGQKWCKVSCDESILLAREKELLNHIRNGGWVAFLVHRPIYDSLSSGYDRRDASKTDLCKRILNGIGIKREPISPSTIVESVRSEFEDFISKYGVAKNSFRTNSPDDLLAVAKIGVHLVGFSHNARLYVLPFHTTNFSADNLQKMASTLVQGISAFVEKESGALPGWTNEFRFDAELELESKIQSMQDQLQRITKDLHAWQRWKGLLAFSGYRLCSLVQDALQQYFGFQVTKEEVGIEDLQLVGAEGEILGVVEVKGTRAGVRRGYISQVDSHRDRRGVDASVPGVLLINNEMDIRDVGQRKHTDVAAEQVSHAARLNILIFRSIDFLLLMRHTENWLIQQRHYVLSEALRVGGGWFTWDQGSGTFVVRGDLETTVIASSPKQEGEAK